MTRLSESTAAIPGRNLPFRTGGSPPTLIPLAPQAAAVRFLNDTRTHDHGMGLLYGPPLSGKTSTIRQLRASRPEGHAAAFLDGAGKDAATLLQEMLRQFGYDIDLRSASERLNMVRVFAMQQAANKCAPLLVVDQAHALKPDALEVLCELAVLKVGDSSALRMILAGEPRLVSIVRTEAMQPISARITGVHRLRPLTRAETAHYVHRKLISGGCRNPESVIPKRACEALHAASGGWPGVIDRLALQALNKAGRRPGARDNPAPRLILTRRGKTLKQVTLDKPRLIIGRGEYNDLCINGDFISRQHAVIFRSGSTTILVDLKSRNGTRVNGKRISSLVVINDDIISIGDHRIKLVDPAARRRTTLRAAGLDETSILKSVADMRNSVARNGDTRPMKTQAPGKLRKLLRIVGY